MKLSIILLSAGLTWAQSTTTTYLTDLNGVRTPSTSYSTTKDGTTSETWQSINGKKVPLEQVSEKVLREDSKGKVTERIVQKLDATGQASGTERVVTEEIKLPAGGSTVRSTTYRTDVNGNPQEAEQKTIETRVQGSTTTVQTMIDRPNVNGSFTPAEKRTTMTDGSATNNTTTESVYRPDSNGGFQEALRSVKTVTKNGDQTIEKTAEYQHDVTGQLSLHGQTNSVTTKLPDGTETTQVDLYANSVAGRALDTAAPMHVKEEQIIERRVLPDGSLTETLSVRHPTTTDPDRLGDLQKLSETVCTGKCVPDKPVEKPADKPKETATPKPVAGNSRL